jgi:hypothetical protein
VPLQQQRNADRREQQCGDMRVILQCDVEVFQFLTLLHCDRGIKNIRVHAVVVSQLEIQQLAASDFGADFVERAAYAALEDAPQTSLNRFAVHSQVTFPLTLVPISSTR